jgi:hypothetical protein
MSQEKVKDLAGQVLEMLVAHPQVHLSAKPEAVRVAIGSVILDDLREEDAIDAEAEELLRQHASEIDGQQLDVELLRRKFRQQIARKRGFVL